MIDYSHYMQSKAWFDRKKGIRDRANGKCERCGSDFKTEVHHLTYANLGDEGDDELILLCRKCHMISHLWGIGKFAGYLDAQLRYSEGEK